MQQTPSWTSNPPSATELHCPIFSKKKEEKKGKKQANSLFLRSDACKLHCRKQVKCFKVLCPACEHTDGKLNGLQLYCGLPVLDGEEDSRGNGRWRKNKVGSEWSCDQRPQSDYCVRQVAMKEPDARGDTTQFEFRPVCRETLFKSSNYILHFGNIFWGESKSCPKLHFFEALSTNTAYIKFCRLRCITCTYIRLSVSATIKPEWKERKSIIILYDYATAHPLKITCVNIVCMKMLH